MRDIEKWPAWEEMQRRHFLERSGPQPGETPEETAARHKREIEWLEAEYREYAKQRALNLQALADYLLLHAAPEHADEITKAYALALEARKAADE